MAPTQGTPSTSMPRPGQGYPAVHEIAAWHVAPAAAGARVAILLSAVALLVATVALIVAVVR